MEYQPGQYMAQLILSDDPYKDEKLFKELTHFITIHSNGVITESHYLNSLAGKDHIFTPERVWDRSTLYDYNLMCL